MQWRITESDTVSRLAEAFAMAFGWDPGFVEYAAIRRTRGRGRGRRYQLWSKAH